VKRGNSLAVLWGTPRRVGLAEGSESEGTYVQNVRGMELLVGIAKAPVARKCAVLSLRQI
jgi:hypothetical protein